MRPGQNTEIFGLPSFWRSRRGRSPRQDSDRLDQLQRRPNPEASSESRQLRMRLRTSLQRMMTQY